MSEKQEKTVKEIMEVEFSPKKKGELAKIAEERTDEAYEEFKAARLKRLIAEEEARTDKAKKEGEVQIAPQNQVQSLFAGRKPEEITAIIKGLDSEDIEKLALINSAMNPNQQSVLFQLLRKPDRSVNDTVALVKTIVEVSKPQPQQGITLEGVAALLKAIKEEKAPQTSQESAIKLAMDYIKPFYETMSEKDKQFYSAQIQNVQSQIVDPIAYLQKIKEVAPSLGFVSASQGGGANMELEKMKLENERWRIEESWKREDRLEELGLKRQSEREKMKLIKDIVGKALDKAGPAIDSAVQAASNKMSGAGKTSPPAKQMATAFLCPECLKEGKQSMIDVADMPDVAKCPECGKEFPKAK